MTKPKGWTNESMRHALARRRIRTSNQMLSDLRRRPEGEKLAQPRRANPDPQLLLTKKDLIQYVASITAEQVKKWNGTIIIDTKYRGIRGLVVVNPKTGRVDIFSRNLKPLDKFEKKHRDQILKDLSPYITSDTIFDAELYALDKNGNVLPQHVVTGYIKNPNDPKYKGLRTLIEIFDVILVNQRDIRNLPLKTRKKLVELGLDYEGRVAYSAEFSTGKNTEKRIEKRLRSVIKEGGEGIVVKDPESEYFHGKPKTPPWVKAKNIDTIDLRLKSISKYPAGKDKPFNFYRHMELVPENSPNHVIGADKGVPGAGFDNQYYINLTKHLLNLVKRGKARGVGNVSVNQTYQKIYGRKIVPKTIIISRAHQPIFEIITEEMSQDLKPAGQKLVGERPDKVRADGMSELRRIYKSFYKQRTPVKDFSQRKKKGGMEMAKKKKGKGKKKGAKKKR